MGSEEGWGLKLEPCSEVASKLAQVAVCQNQSTHLSVEELAAWLADQFADLLGRA